MSATTRKTLAALAIAAAAFAGTLGAVATTAVVNPGIAQAAPVPSTGELRGKIATLFNAGASRSARAAELETGEAGLPAFDRAAALIAIAPPSWRYDVVGPVTVDGDTLNATIFTATDGYEPWTFPVSWRNVGGTWKLTQESICTIGNFVGSGC